MPQNIFAGGTPDKKTFYRQLATLLSSGFSLSSALGNLEHNTPGILENVVSSFRKNIAESKTLAEAMEVFSPEIFSSFETGVVEAGEASGNLPESMARLAEYFEFSSGIRNKLIAGLTYPVVLLHLAVLIPAVPVLFLKGFGAFLVRVLPFLAFLYIFFFTAVFLYRYSGRVGYLAEKRDRIIFDIPWLGKFLQKMDIIRFLKSFTTLYIAGVGIVRAVELAGGTVGNAYMKNDIRQSVPLLKEGKKLSDIFAGKSWMPSVVHDMLKTGEVSGSMDETLDRVAGYLREEADVAVEQFVKLLPVAVYLIVAAYIGYIVISFYARYFQMLNSF
ncbi:MAG TPA: type II secretion system F family protein [bacterium]|nr:type II secretion system F family protein [bacterium]